MAELKTKPNRRSVKKFLDGVADARRRGEAFEVLAMMEEVTAEKAVMWGESIVGFGVFEYKYASGREGGWMVTGFSPRKSNLTIYIMSGFSRLEELLAKLGKHKRGKSCLYINRLTDVDVKVLRRLIKASVGSVRRGDISYDGC